MISFSALRQRLTGPVREEALQHRTALSNIRRAGVEAATLIDVGAARGDWTAMARAFWPDARAHLIEAKEEWRAALDAFTAQTPATSYVIAAAAAETGEAYFAPGEDAFGGAAYREQSVHDDRIRLPAVTPAAEAARLGLKGPFGLKLDTHGTEADILAGAETTLRDAAFVCVECYNLIGQLPFAELTLRMKDLGFACFGMADPLFRPSDGAFWQMDLFFLPSGHKAFAFTGYR